MGGSLDGAGAGDVAAMAVAAVVEGALGAKHPPPAAPACDASSDGGSRSNGAQIGSDASPPAPPPPRGEGCFGEEEGGGCWLPPLLAAAATDEEEEVADVAAIGAPWSGAPCLGLASMWQASDASELSTTCAATPHRQRQDRTIEMGAWCVQS